jgi:hypothetical protein
MTTLDDKVSEAVKLIKTLGNQPAGSEEMKATFGAISEMLVGAQDEVARNDQRTAPAAPSEEVARLGGEIDELCKLELLTSDGKINPVLEAMKTVGQVDEQVAQGTAPQVSQGMKP